MKIGITYKFISALLCSTVLFGLIVPGSSHAGMMDHCDMMEMHDENSQENMHDHMEMNDNEDCCSNFDSMKHHPTQADKPDSEMCDMTFECDCYYTTKSSKTEAPIIHKVKTPKLTLTSIDTSLNLEFDPCFPPPLWLSSSYSPPLLFLANESFLI